MEREPVASTYKQGNNRSEGSLWMIQIWQILKVVSYFESKISIFCAVLVVSAIVMSIVLYNIVPKHF